MLYLALHSCFYSIQSTQLMAWDKCVSKTDRGEIFGCYGFPGAGQMMHLTNALVRCTTRSTLPKLVLKLVQIAIHICRCRTNLLVDVVLQRRQGPSLMVSNPQCAMRLRARPFITFSSAAVDCLASATL